MYAKLNVTISKALLKSITGEREKVLLELVNYIKKKRASGEKPLLNFICTHNSRRSQFSQIWAQTAAAYYGIDVACFSGGVEVTAFNERAVASINRSGFKIEKEGETNPKYNVFYAQDSNPIIAFSKVFDDPTNPSNPFAAVMTCAHADENCPFIPSAEKRIPVRYEDPKFFDDSPEEAEKYDERSLQIASEMLYVFKNVSAL